MRRSTLTPRLPDPNPKPDPNLNPNPNPTPNPNQLNASANASSPRESTSYTSLVATGERSGFVVYSRHKPPGPDVAFAMPFWLDNGELVERAVP